jgi:hypothetical protein
MKIEKHFSKFSNIVFILSKDRIKKDRIIAMMAFLFDYPHERSFVICILRKELLLLL